MGHFARNYVGVALVTQNLTAVAGEAVSTLDVSHYTSVLNCI